MASAVLRMLAEIMMRQLDAANRVQLQSAGVSSMSQNQIDNQSYRRMRDSVMMLAIIASSLLISPSVYAQVGEMQQTPTTYRRQFDSKLVNFISRGHVNCATKCHSGGKPNAGEQYAANEWDIWYQQEKGPHFVAYKRLLEDPRSDVMAKLLYGPEATAITRSECLSCHALFPEKERRDSRFVSADGVSCESCHGYGRGTDRNGWADIHQDRAKFFSNYTTAQRTEMGFYDLRDLSRRAERCISCHVGTENQRVTHDMMAAGHPPLMFEMDYYSSGVPKHWPEKNSFISEDEGEWIHVRSWATGQAVALRESLHRIIEWSAGKEKIDFAFLDCYACHHDLDQKTKQLNWRQQRGFLGQRGEPTWDEVNWSMCRTLVRLYLPGEFDAAQKNATRLLQSLSLSNMDRAAVAQSADALRKTAERLVAKVAVNKFDKAQSLSILQSLATDRDYVTSRGFSAANQAVFAVNALYFAAFPKAAAADDAGQVAAAIVLRMNNLVSDENDVPLPASYDARKMSSLLAEFQAALPGK